MAAALIDNDYHSIHGAPDFAVGKLPAGFPLALLPSGPVTVLGGMTTNGEVIAVLTDSTRRLSAVLEDQFAKIGYAQAAPDSGSGFAPPASRQPYFCKGDEAVWAQPIAGPHAEIVRVSYRPQGGAYYCRAFHSPPAPSVLNIPALTPPPGVHVGSSHGGAGSGDVTTEAEASGTGLVPSAILSHYAAQLVAAGWLAVPPAISERVAAQFLEAKTASGTVWEGVLVVSGGTTAVHMTLSMRPGTKP